MLASWKWRSALLAQVLVLGPLEVSGPAKEPPTAHPGRIRISVNSENSLFLEAGGGERQPASVEEGSLLTSYMIWEAQFALFQEQYFAL